MRTALNVLPKGNAMVTDYGALVARGKTLGGPPIRKIGWSHDPNTGPKVKDPQSGRMVGNGVFKRVNDVVVTIPADSEHYEEYIRALQGDPRQGPASAALWPADEATAQEAGVRFDRTFGGEHPECAAKLAPPVAHESAAVHETHEANVAPTVAEHDAAPTPEHDHANA